MNHCISIQQGSSYSGIVNRISQEDSSVEVRELTNEAGGYQLLVLSTRSIISEETEKAVDQLDNVIVSTFNVLEFLEKSGEV